MSGVNAPVEVTFKATGVPQVQRGLKLVASEAEGVGGATRRTGNSLNLLAASAASGTGSLAGMAVAAGNVAEGMAAMSKSAGVAASAVGIGVLIAAIGVLVGAAMDAKKALDALPEGKLAASAEGHLKNLHDEKSIKAEIESIDKRRAAEQAKLSGAEKSSGGITGYLKRNVGGFNKDGEKIAQHVADLDAQRAAALTRQREIVLETRQRDLKGVQVAVDAQTNALSEYRASLKAIEAERIDAIRTHALTEVAADQEAIEKIRVARMKLNEFLRSENLRNINLQQSNFWAGVDETNAKKNAEKERVTGIVTASIALLQTNLGNKYEELTANSKGTGYRGLKAEFDSKAVEGKKVIAAFAKEMQTEIDSVVGASLVAGFEAAFQQGSISGGFAALGASLLSGLGSFMEQLGQQMVVVGVGLEAFAEAILSLNGGAAIAAGVALIAGGAALKGIGGSIGGSSSGGGASGGGYSAGTGMGSIIDRGIINPGNAASTAASMTPRTPVQANFTLIGTKDPTVIRSIDEILRGINQRGSLAGGR